LLEIGFIATTLKFWSMTRIYTAFTVFQENYTVKQLHVNNYCTSSLDDLLEFKKILYVCV